MSVEVLDSSLDNGGNNYSDSVRAATAAELIDARRRVEDKIEEMRLSRETQEYDFDF